MQRKLIIATVLAAIGVSGAAMAAGKTNSAATEAQMFQSAKVKLDQAGQIALKQVPGTLAAIGFNDENGKGVYEAMVVDAKGQATIVKIDADSGAVLGSMLASNSDEEDQNGVENDAENGENAAEDGGSEAGENGEG